MAANCFNAYANYYDLLYQDKNYSAEVAYIHDLIQQHKPESKTLLNLGCGTGQHDYSFAQLGYEVCGVDLSDSMLEIARKRFVAEKLKFYQGDVRAIELDRSFDLVLSLFHVMSYQTSDQDVRAMLTTAARHLNPGGMLLFDFWHGGGVLQDPPTIRIKRLENNTLKIVRIAEPELKTDQKIVNVNYQLFAFDKETTQYSDLKETHSMRYFFVDEMKAFLAETGFALKEAVGWMSDIPLNTQWYGLIMAHKE